MFLVDGKIANAYTSSVCPVTVLINSNDFEFQIFIVVSQDALTIVSVDDEDLFNEFVKRSMTSFFFLFLVI